MRLRPAFADSTTIRRPAIADDTVLTSQQVELVLTSDADHHIFALSCEEAGEEGGEESEGQPSSAARPESDAPAKERAKAYANGVRHVFVVRLQSSQETVAIIELGTIERPNEQVARPPPPRAAPFPSPRTRPPTHRRNYS